MGKSSKDKRDAYYRLAKEQNWRARSAFKLIQIDEEFDLFSFENPAECTRVVDLCAAPGSWSQVLSRILIKGENFGRRAWVEQQEEINQRVFGNLDEGFGGLSLEKKTVPNLRPRDNVKIVAIDLQPMADLPGVTTLKADITHPSTVPSLLQALDPDYDASREVETHRVDLVLSDGAPDVTGLHDLDIYVQSQLLFSALSLAIKVLRVGGKFVAKIFRAKSVDLIYAQLKTLFRRVSVAKPRSSRASSLEAFVVCEYFEPPAEWEGKLSDLASAAQKSFAEASGSSRGHGVKVKGKNGNTEMYFDDQEMSGGWLPAFLACGDLNSWDADASYKLPPDHVSLDPVQPPTAPPYREALERKRAEGGFYGKTKKASKTTSESPTG
ncbi:MAG: hypothetical protein Q9227_001964 [Pyrenula ochraceoflavens]